jgi:RNA polymerase sigma-54 factor
MNNNLSIKLDIKPQQKLILTPQMKLSLNILQMNMIDVIKEINTIVEENPALEIIDTYNESDLESINNNIDQHVEEQRFLNFEDRENFNYSKKSQSDEINYENFVTQPLSLYDHLLFQLHITGLDSLSKTIGEYIIGNLDQDGYFRLDIDFVAEEFGVSVDKVESVLKVIQKFDPPGIASLTLEECIINQLRDMNINDIIIKEIVHLVDLINKDRKQDIQSVLSDKQYSNEYIEYLMDILKKIDPKPGLKYSESVKYIYPDVYIQKSTNGFNVFLNERDIPVLKVNEYYTKMLEQKNLDENTKQYIEDKIKNAEWIIKSLLLRKQAILKVTEAIVEFQRDFFLKGYDYLKPMRLKDISKKTGLHESTISRVTAGKYAFTEYGLIELKILFKKGYETTNGAVSVDNIKKLIVSIIKEEPPENPYSDKKIAEILSERGVKIARRTVSKYREEINIPTKILRKKEN